MPPNTDDWRRRVSMHSKGAAVAVGLMSRIRKPVPTHVLKLDPSHEDFQPPPGSRAGTYTLVEVLRTVTTNSGVFYKATGDNGSMVLVKLLRGPGHDPQVFEKKRQDLARAGKAPPEARVVRLVGAWQEPSLGGCYCLATAPYCSEASLYIRCCPSSSLVTRLRWALEVAETLLCLHRTPGVEPTHGALTPRKVAFQHRYGAYLLDLGVSLKGRPRGSQDYSSSLAPEMVQGGKSEEKYNIATSLLSVTFDQSADVWSWGVLLYGLLSWSLKRMGGDMERAWFASLPGQDRAAWEHELVRGAEGTVSKEGWGRVLELMLDCLRPSEERVGLETVVHVMRRALGYAEAPSLLVTLDVDLIRRRAEGGWSVEDSVDLLRQKAEDYDRRQQHAHQRVCLEQAVSMARSHEVKRVGLLACCLTQLANVIGCHQGEHAQAAVLHEEALTLWRAAMPAGDCNIATSLCNLGDSYQSQGKLKQARALFEQALAIRRAALPPEHPDLATTLNNLALVLQDQEEYAEARPLFEEALAIRRAALPPGHEKTRCALRQLACVTSRQGDYARSRGLYAEALALQRAALPPAHPDTIAVLQNLAWVHARLGEHVQAQPLYKEVIVLLRDTPLPGWRRDMAAALCGLADVHETQGRLAKAQELYEVGLAMQRRALVMHKSELPGLHVDTADTMYKLACLHEKRGNHTQAEPLFEEALKIRRRALPSGHADIGSCVDSLASLYLRKGECAKAVPMYEEALAHRRATLPSGHPEIAKTLISLASMHRNLGEDGKALPLFLEAFAMCRTALAPCLPSMKTRLTNEEMLLEIEKQGECLIQEEGGCAPAIWRLSLPPDCPEHTLSSLATLHFYRGKSSQPRQMLEEALTILRATRPPGHADVINCIENLASLNMSDGEYERARPFYEELLTISRAKLPPGHANIATCLHSLARLQLLLRKPDQALPLYEKALAIMRAIPPPGHPESAFCLVEMQSLRRSIKSRGREG